MILDAVNGGKMGKFPSQQNKRVPATMVEQLLAGRHHAGSVLLSVEVSSVS